MVALTLALQPLRSQTTTDATPLGSGCGRSLPPRRRRHRPRRGVTVSTNKTAPAHTMPYTVVAGDTLTKLADKFNTTRKKLKALNDLAVSKLTPGQVISRAGDGEEIGGGCRGRRSITRIWPRSRCRISIFPPRILGRARCRFRPAAMKMRTRVRTAARARRSRNWSRRRRWRPMRRSSALRTRSRRSASQMTSACARRFTAAAAGAAAGAENCRRCRS